MIEKYKKVKGKLVIKRNLNKFFKIYVLIYYILIAEWR